jgi:di/tripeptidase
LQFLVQCIAITQTLDSTEISHVRVAFVYPCGIIKAASQRPGLPVCAWCVQLAVGGLLGGHSGLCIHEGRANALVLLARALK